MKKSKLGCVLVYSAIFCGVGVLTGNGIATKIDADSSEVTWGHYPGVDPTFSTPGCNEYWCQCGTNIISLEEPTGGTILERERLSVDIIENLEDF